jgi:hypothetical protein
MGFVLSKITVITSLNIIHELSFVMEKCYVFFDVHNDFLNIIHTSFNFKWLTTSVATNFDVLTSMVHVLQVKNQ